MTSTCIYPCDRCGITIEDWTDKNPMCQKCSMIEERKIEWNKTHPHSQVELELGRELESVILSTKGECGDCMKMSKYLIVEKKDVDLCTECGKDKIRSNEYLKAFYWCGECLVG